MACTFRGESWYSWYCALILMGCYAVGELGHFLIGIVSRPIAQDMKFGDQGCLANDTSAEEEAGIHCQGTNETRCSLLSYNGTVYCEWNYTGSGLLYQLLAGPSFIAVFSVMGIILGVLGDMYNRIRLLTVCVFGYSLMIVLTGLSTQYWQLILLRFGFGAGEAGCSPLTASIVADKFEATSRGFAMSIFNWGIYFGYGLAFTVGNYVTKADIMGQGWRWSYFLAGIPGFVMASLLLTTVKEPQRRDITTVQTRPKPHDNAVEAEANDTLMQQKSAASRECEQVTPPRDGALARLWKCIKVFVHSPAVLTLLLAASVRHTASFCWAYNTQLYFNYYYPDVDLGLWMLICSIVGGSIGIASGGVISDLVVSKYGISTRLWVLVGSQAIASPLAALVLYLRPPYCFVALLSAYLFAEMWFGILFTVLVEMFALSLRSTSIALFIFVMNNLASSGQLLVPTLKPILGFREALYLTYPGFYGLSSFLFLITQLVIRRSVRTKITLPDDDAAPVDQKADQISPDSETSEEKGPSP